MTSKPFSELRETGLLWLINTTVFHPRGFALALIYEDGECTGWKLLGDGTEPWTFSNPEEDFQAVTKTFAALQALGGGENG